MVLYFDNCDVAINRSGIMATSASISATNSLTPLQSIGYQSNINQSPNDSIRNITQINYIPEINNEQNYLTLQSLKTLKNTIPYTGNRIEIAGVVQEFCFLTNYSLKLFPNGMSEASVQYESYWPLCANQVKMKEGRFNYDADGTIPHGWGAIITSSQNDGEIYEFNYSFKPTWSPVYSIGNKYPSQVELMAVEETFNLSTNIFQEPSFYGIDLENNIITGNSNIKLYDLTKICYPNEIVDHLSFSISGAKIRDCELSVSVGDILRTNISAFNYY